MKLVTAVIKPHMVQPVTDALHAIDVEGITLTEVRGHGRQRGHTEVFRGAEYKVDFLPKMRIEIVTDDVNADRVAQTIMAAARSGKIGDGKIWITAVDSILRIRTGISGSRTTRSETSAGTRGSATITTTMLSTRMPSPGRTTATLTRTIRTETWSAAVECI